MVVDALVGNPGRMRILTVLAKRERMEFVSLRRATQLTDGNLCAHGRRLASAGLVNVEKSIEGGKPVTRFMLTERGREALREQFRRLEAALRADGKRAEPVAEWASGAEVEVRGFQEDWVD